MNKWIGLLFVFTPAIFNAQGRIVEGYVKDAETRQALPYCSIVLMQTKQVSNSNQQGYYTLVVPDSVSEPILLVSYLGYGSDTLRITDESKASDIFLKSNGFNLNEVTITGNSDNTAINENPLATLRISLKSIEGSSESNIMDVLAKHAPGLNTVKTGPNISKPFIRGLGYNRVLTQYDGVRQEGQQWGDEHGIEADAYNIEKAEVIKGPASLMYGSDALAGVISLTPYIPTVRDSVLNGKFLSEFQHNNQLVGNGIRLGHYTGHWLYALRGSYRLAGNYRNEVDGKVYNTGFNEKNASALFGYHNSKGYSHLNISLYDNIQGIPDGSRDSLSRKFTKQVFEDSLDLIKSRPLVSNNELNALTPGPLHQHIQHYRLYTNNVYHVGKHKLEARLAFQQNIRREYNHPTQVTQPGMYVQLNTINYGANYLLPVYLHTQLSLGLNGMLQLNNNKNGTNFPIPDYRLSDAGGYLLLDWKFKRWTLNAGARLDNRAIDCPDFYIRANNNTGFLQHVKDTNGATLQFPAFKQNFSGTSWSTGFTYKLTSNSSIKCNVARGYRAPNISEICSNGLDPGAHIVYLGNKSFVPEFSLQQDVGYLIENNFISGSISLFNNSISHYIYLAQLTDEQGNPIVLVQGNKTYQYQQASARLYGLEAALKLTPGQVKNLSVNAEITVVYGNNTKDEFKNKGVQGQYLPLIPPLKLSGGINQGVVTKHKVLQRADVKLELEYTAAQKRYLALNNTETPTAAYTLMNASVSLDVGTFRKSKLQLLLQCNNVFNTSYQSNLSRLKYFEYYSLTPDNRYGIYNMGRNFCVKLIAGF